MRYRYTPEGWLDTITKADGVTISYEYDKTGNVTKETASDGTVTNHEYNAIGELVTTESGEGVTKYQYNSKGYLTYVVNPGGEVVSYTYDDYGRKVALKYPDGKTVSYTYDEMDRMTGVTGLDGDTTAYTYDAAGRRTGTKNSTLETTYAYDAVGNLTKQATTGKTEISFEYVYNLNNGITEETRVENGNAVKSQYTYDKLGQLTSFVKSDGHSETYAYDKAGNMLEKVLNSTKISMTYDAANELRTMSSVGGKIDYSYDANGNLTAKTLGTKTDTYTYDNYNQLTSYKGYDGYQQRYTYNAQGHMIRKESKGNDQRQTLEEIVRGDEKKAASDGGDDDDPDPYAGKSASDSWQVTSYIYDITAPYYEVLAETTDGVTTSYDYGVERLAAYSGKQKTEYVYDGRGSVAQEISYNNSWYTFGGKLGKAKVVSKSYSPFGEQLCVAVSGYGFNGESYDSATGMLNLRARQYEPTLMRFSQRDILRGDLSIPLSLNRYLYCANDPVNFVDFDGQSLKSLWNKAKNIASSAAKAVARVATNAYNAVKTTVNNAIKNVGTAFAAIKQTARKISNTVQDVVNTAKTSGLAAAIKQADTSIRNAPAYVANTYAAVKAEIQSNNAQTAQELADFKKDSAQAMADFATEFYGELSDRNKKIIDDMSAKVKQLQEEGASFTEIAAVMLHACREIGKNVGETTVEAISGARDEITNIIVDKAKAESNATATWDTTIINNQSSYSSQKGSYGLTGSIADNACGIIALTNAINITGGSVSFEEVYRNAIMSNGAATMFGGSLGTDPLYVVDQLKKSGYQTKTYIWSADKISTDHDAYIALYAYAFGAHYVAAQYDPTTSKYTVFNDAVLVPVNDFGELLKLNNAIGIYVIGIDKP